jgi:hypothetical protein
MPKIFTDLTLKSDECSAPKNHHKMKFMKIPTAQDSLRLFFLFIFQRKANERKLPKCAQYDRPLARDFHAMPCTLPIMLRGTRYRGKESNIQPRAPLRTTPSLLLPPEESTLGTVSRHAPVSHSVFPVPHLEWN